ncbi:MAG: hypothetical protein AAFR37_05210 [Cyanobacteria bacterium J06628_3]
MPQFDKFTFFNQIFWLVLIFSGFYFILLKNYLPKIGSVLKARNKKLLRSNSLAENYKLEEVATFENSNRLFNETSALCRENLLSGFEKSNSWLTVSNQNIFIGDLRITKSNYLQSFGKLSARKFLI